LTWRAGQTSFLAHECRPRRASATHGGSFPIYLTGGVCIGSITVSGLPQREDHELVVGVLASHLAVPMAQIALD
jgi:uncharacterized protein (UPF0303 family)